MLAPTFALLALSSLAAAAPFAVTVPGGNPVIIVDATFVTGSPSSTSVTTSKVAASTSKPSSSSASKGTSAPASSHVSSAASVASASSLASKTASASSGSSSASAQASAVSASNSTSSTPMSTSSVPTSSVSSAAPSSTSAAASRSMKGMVKLTGAFSGDLGYVFNDINTYTGFATVSYPNATEAQIVTLPASSCGSLVAPFEIGAITPNASAYPYMGLSTLSQSASVLDPNANSTAGNYAVILGTLDGPPGALSGTKNNSLSSAPGRGSEYAGGQSSVWSLNCTDMTFTATWIDAKGASVPLGNFYSSTYDGDNGEPYGKPYNGAFNIAEPTKGFFGPGGHPHKVYGPNGGPDNGQIVLVTEALTMTFVPTA